MKDENYVIFKARKDGILVILSEECSFIVLCTALKKKAAEAASFFSDAKTAITFSGRKLSEREEIELVNIFHEVTDLNITFVSSQGNAVEKKSSKPSEGAKTAVIDRTNLSADENVTYFHRGSLRSGQSISYTGSVVLYGDLNPGAEIIAEGNIVILGYAKGLVHAGCSGNKDCYVFALNLQPTQLRIADQISLVSSDAVSKLKVRTEPRPTVAFILGEEIVIDIKEKF